MYRPPSLFSRLDLIPQEEKLDIEPKKKKLSFGIPKETQFEEKRVAMTPSLVDLLTSLGHKIIIEDDAGKHAGYSNEVYENAGARVTGDVKEVFKCPVIIKIAPPSLDEIDMMSVNAVLISSLQMKIQNITYFKKLSKKKDKCYSL